VSCSSRAQVDGQQPGRCHVFVDVALLEQTPDRQAGCFNRITLNRITLNRIAFKRIAF